MGGGIRSGLERGQDFELGGWIKAGRGCKGNIGRLQGGKKDTYDFIVPKE